MNVIYDATSASSLDVCQILECRRAIYEAQLEHFSIPAPVARRLWTRESDLLDITANVVLGKRARALRTQIALRQFFFDQATSGIEVLDSVMRLSSIATLEYLKEMIDTGLIENCTLELEQLSYVLESTRLLLTARVMLTPSGYAVYDSTAVPPITKTREGVHLS